MGQFIAAKSGGPGAGQRIYRWLRGQIAEGTLVAGDTLPSTRTLAAEWGVSRTTVTQAYEQLAAEGYVQTSAGRATRVAMASAAPRAGAGSRRAPPGHAGARPPVPADARLAGGLSAWGRRLESLQMRTLPPTGFVPLDFRYGAIASRDFPALAWQRAYRAALLRQQPGLYYLPPEGDAGLRRALQGYLRRARGVVCDAEDIVVVHGSQQAIDLCARVLLDAHSRFVLEDPAYGMAVRCFEATGAQAVPVPVDDQGLQVAALPAGTRIGLAYVTPSHQFPLGGTLPIGRRQALLDWAARAQAWIVEDDYDGEFRYGQRPVDALQAIDAQGRVIYVGTFSKMLSPQMRLGYLVLPPTLVPLFRKAKQLADRHAPMLEQCALAALIDSGAYERHVRRMRRANDRRRAALLAAVARHLPGQARIEGAAAGLHVVLWLDGIPWADEAAVVANARRHGVGVYPLSPLFAVTPTTGVAGLILGYASLTCAQIEEGVCRLAAAIAQSVAPASHRPAGPCGMLPS